MGCTSKQHRAAVNEQCGQSYWRMDRRNQTCEFDVPWDSFFPRSLLKRGGKPCGQYENACEDNG